MIKSTILLWILSLNTILHANDFKPHQLKLGEELIKFEYSLLKPLKTISESDSLKSLKTAHGVQLQYLSFLKSKEFDKASGLALDLEQAKKFTASFKAEGSNMAERVVKSYEQKSIYCELRQKDFSIIVLKNPDSDKRAYSYWVSKKDGDLYKTIALPFYYRKDLKGLLSVFSELDQGKWTP